MRITGRILWALPVLFLSGCGPGPVRHVGNPDPSGKIPAIKRAVREKDRRSIQQLVKDLASDDPAVRFYAIEGLQRLTGETFNYRYYDDEDSRQPALLRWHKWLAEQSR